MTITMRTTKVVYLPDGTQTQFPVPFPVFDEGDVECLQVDGLTETLLTAFTVSDITAGSGYVTFSTPPAAGKSLVVRRRTARVQESDYPVAGRFPADVVERDFDRLTGMVQELDEQMDRAVLAPSDGSVDPGDLFDELTATVGKAQAYANAADASANIAEDMATNAGNSAQAAANSADTAAQTVQTAAADAVNAATAQADAAEISAAAAVQAAEQAVAAIPDNLVQRVTDAEAQNTQQDNRLDAVESGVAAIATTLIGSIQTMLCADSYVPNGCVAADGGEYTRAQFPTLYDTYLVGGRLLTCTYEQQAAQVGLTGNCGKFALDVSAQKFKVPLLKDGDSITQAASAAEIGKSVKAGLPNITATVGKIWGAETATGACSRGNNESNVSAGAGSVNYGPVYFDASRSSSVYGNSTTVTDEQVRLRHFVVVASAQNNSSVFDWANYMSALAGKANVDLGNVDLSKANIVLQRVVVEGTTMTSTTAVIPCDDTIPQITEGSQYLVDTITPKRANSKIDVEVTLCATCYNATSHLVAAVFKDSVPDAVAASLVTNGGVGFFTPLRIKKTIQFSDTNPHTISVRVGVPNNSYPISINGTSARILGGAITSSLILTEYAV